MTSKFLQSLIVPALLLAGPAAPAQDAQLQQAAEIVNILKGRYVDSDRLDDQYVNDALVQGLLKAIGPGVQLMTAEQAAVKPAPRVVSGTLAEPLARVEVIEPNIGYIRLADVTPEAEAALDRELKKFSESKVTGYVLDLRFADGTNFAAAATVASRFIAGEPELFAVKEHGIAIQSHRAAAPSAALPAEPTDAPLMVLVNADTRGAAEVVAGVLRSQERAILVGGRTAGNAIAWQDIALSGDRVLRIATTKVALPGDVEIFPNGLTPDVPVKIELAREREAVLMAATNITLTASLQPPELRKGMREADLMRVFRGQPIESPPLTLSTNRPATESAVTSTNGGAAGSSSTNVTLAAETKPEPNGNGAPREVRDIVLQRAVDILKGIRVLLSRL